MTGILCANRGLAAPAICPDCEVVLFPIFEEGSANIYKDTALPSIIPEELSNAIINTMDAGVKIINLSLGLSTSSLIINRYPPNI